MEEKLMFCFLNKCNKSDVLKAYRVLAKRSLLISRIILICFEVIMFTTGLTTNNSQLIIASIFMGVIIFYVVFNLDKIQVKNLNKKYNFNENMPDKFLFYSSYLLYEKNSSGTSDIGKLLYDEIDSVYISTDVIILQSIKMSEVLILNKTQIDTSILKKFLDYLQEQFNGRIKNKAL
ncbi:MAG: hypothetical protein E6929_05485 [Clostridium sp.]|nr:hypothetical protein [Clostridium sp.]